MKTQEKPQGRFLKTAVLVAFFVLFAYLLKNLNIFDADGLLTDLHVMGEMRFVKLVFVGVATVLLIFFVPVSTVAATAGLLFELDGILLITISGLLSALVSYGLAKIFKSDATRWVEKLYQRKEREIPLEELYEKIKDHGFSYALFVRAIPFMPFQVGNLLFGVSSVTLWDYITTTLITVAIGQGITVFLVSMASDFMAQKAGTVFGLLLKGLYYLGIYYIMKKNIRAEEKEELPL